MAVPLILLNYCEIRKKSNICNLGTRLHHFVGYMKTLVLTVLIVFSKYSSTCYYLIYIAILIYVLTCLKLNSYNFKN